MPEKWQVKCWLRLWLWLPKEVGNAYNSTHFRKNMYTNGRPASGGGKDVLVVSNYTLQLYSPRVVLWGTSSAFPNLLSHFWKYHKGRGQYRNPFRTLLNFKEFYGMFNQPSQLREAKQKQKKETHTRRLHATSNIINNRLLMESLNALFKHNLTECSP